LGLELFVREAGEGSELLHTSGFGPIWGLSNRRAAPPRASSINFVMYSARALDWICIEEGLDAATICSKKLPLGSGMAGRLVAGLEAAFGATG